ncbi:AAA family ATPase [Desulfotruncus alcoholivorax]|uniref:AAA family ATPase n=1 Tax=Desulfotruncus alcoholivorax TaxID=265477 RepID=UPI00042027BB|nr:AAA family ATPase [Desulfotruncus alcoholivorax]
MRINKLAIQGFRNHINNAIGLDKLNIFVGRNNSGKSSILAAVEWALTGRNLWTDRAGRGAGDLITKGAKTCQVGLEIAGLGGVVRALPPHTLTVGKSRNIQEAQVAIYHHLGADEQLVQLALNAGAFTSMTPAEQKTFLFALCGISCTAEEIASATVQYLQRTGIPVDQAGEVATRVKALLPRGFGGDPAILEGMEKRAREQRRETKKDLERTRSALAEMELPNLPDGIGLEDKDAVEKQLAELEIEKNKLLKAHGAGQAAEKNMAKCRDRVNKLATELERLNSEKATLEGEMPGQDQPGRLAGELNRLKVRLEQLAGTAAELDRELAALEAANRARRAVVEKLQAFDGRCPLAAELIACRMSGSEVAELVNQLESEIKASMQNNKSLLTSMQNLQAEKRDLQHRINHIEKTIADLDTTRQKLLSLDTAIERTQKELDSAWGEVYTWEETLQKGGANPEEIDRIQERIVQGREILRRLEVAGYGRRQARQLQQDLEMLEKELAITERMVKALGPDGIRQSLLGDRLSGLTSEINKLLAACTEGRYQLTWQVDFTPLITQNGHALPFKLLSKSEQLRVGIAFQAAIAKMTGLSFLAVDEVDMLDQDNRDLLTGSLLEILDQLDQILLFCTVGDVIPQNPGLPGLKMFWVENGVVSEISSGGKRNSLERSESLAAV